MSHRIMKGHKGRLFYICISFIPLYLLSMLSCGLAVLWIEPYSNTVMANFYMDLMRQRDPENPGTDNGGQRHQKQVGGILRMRVEQIVEYHDWRLAEITDYAAHKLDKQRFVRIHFKTIKNIAYRHRLPAGDF